MHIIFYMFGECFDRAIHSREADLIPPRVEAVCSELNQRWIHSLEVEGVAPGEVDDRPPMIQIQGRLLAHLERFGPVFIPDIDQEDLPVRVVQLV